MLASVGCGIAFTTANTISGMSAAVKGRVLDLFSCRAPGLIVCPLFVPAVAAILVAEDLVLAGSFLGGGFFFCCAVPAAVKLFADIRDLFSFRFGGIFHPA